MKYAPILMVLLACPMVGGAEEAAPSAAMPETRSRIGYLDPQRGERGSRGQTRLALLDGTAVSHVSLPCAATGLRPTDRGGFLVWGADLRLHELDAMGKAIRTVDLKELLGPNAASLQSAAGLADGRLWALVAFRDAKAEGKARELILAWSEDRKKAGKAIEFPDEELARVLGVAFGPRIAKPGQVVRNWLARKGGDPASAPAPAELDALAASIDALQPQVELLLSEIGLDGKEARRVALPVPGMIYGVTPCAEGILVAVDGHIRIFDWEAKERFSLPLAEVIGYKDAVLLPNGHFLVAADTTPKGGKKSGFGGEVDREGRILWKGAHDCPRSVQLTPDDTVIVGGG